MSAPLLHRAVTFMQVVSARAREPAIAFAPVGQSSSNRRMHARDPDRNALRFPGEGRA